MEKALLVYWTSTGNTESLAEAIKEEIGSEIDLTYVHVSENPSLEGYDRYFLGAPATGTEELDAGEFEPWFASVESEFENKKVALFGCYGWGGGAWMRSWEDRLKAVNANIFEEGFICLEAPDDEVLSDIKAFSKRFLAY